MKFSIPCATFVRLANTSMQADDNVLPEWGDGRDFLRTVRLENRNGATFGIASNSFILSVELLGETDEPNGAVNVTTNDILMDQCRTEANFDSSLIITEQGGWATAQTTFGYMYPDNAAIPGEWPDWRALLIETPTAKKGATAFDAEMIARIGLSSPSGLIVFPKLENLNRPVVVNDSVDPDWLGAFLPVTDKGTPFKYAVLKDWAK